MQCISELPDDERQRYTLGIERAEQRDPEVIITLILKDGSSCFHMAMTWTDPDIEYAKAVCAQAVLDRTDDDDACLYFAVYDSLKDTVYFCLCDPSKKTLEDVSRYSIRSHQREILNCLKEYVPSNAEVLFKQTHR
jgi:hypothetical protein